jgi:AcrR family transcriptional regulator
MMARTARKSRRTHAERRSATQAAILAAALKLLIEDGYAGFKASRVAARAGVSRGAQEHYYPKKIDLIGAATRFAMEEAVRHAQSLAASAAQSSDPIEKFLADSEHFFFAPIFRALVEIMIAAHSDRAPVRGRHQRVLQIGRGILPRSRRGAQPGIPGHHRCRHPAAGRRPVPA